MMPFQKKDSLNYRKKLLENRIQQLQYDLNKSKIYAPFNGYITEEHTQVGPWLEEGGNVVELIDIDNVEVVVDMPEKYVHQVRVGEEVSVRFNSLPEIEFKGQLVSIVPEADQASRAFPVKIKILNPDHTIKALMSAKATFNLGELKSASLVPKDSITDSGGTKIVFIVRNGVAQPVPVITGTALDNYIEIQGEFEVGEQVVVRGNERLRPMQPVEITSEN